MGFALIRALAPSNCKWVFATLKVWRKWDLTRVFDRETRWVKVGWVITFQIKSEPCSPWKKYNRSEPSEFSLLKEGRSRRKFLGVGFFMTALVEMNYFLSGSTRFSNGPYHAIIPDHTALKNFLNEPWPRRDISGLGLASIRTAPASYGMERLSLCNMALSERINQTETEKGLKKDDLENIDEPLQSKLAFELVKIDERSRKVSEKRERKKAERYAYLFAAIASSVGITSMAAGAVYYRFVWQVQGGEVPFTEMFGTFSLAVGATIGMEAWARWAHRALWHSFLWSMHESHHRPREGPFELNDVFAIINAVPAISLLSYGFFNKGFVPGLCFGAGLGITVFGMAYMFVHDGLVHRRFPVGPIADVPYLQRVAAAHQLHHADKFNGVPYGLFLGPKEIEMVGGVEELDKLVKARAKTAENPTESAKTL